MRLSAVCHSEPQTKRHTLAHIHTHTNTHAHTHTHTHTHTDTEYHGVMSEAETEKRGEGWTGLEEDESSAAGVSDLFLTMEKHHHHHHLTPPSPLNTPVQPLSHQHLPLPS